MSEKRMLTTDERDDRERTITATISLIGKHFSVVIEEKLGQLIGDLLRSHDAADARIAELEAAIKAHRQALADCDYSPNVDDMALYRVLDKR